MEARPPPPPAQHGLARHASSQLEDMMSDTLAQAVSFLDLGSLAELMRVNKGIYLRLRDKRFKVNALVNDLCALRKRVRKKRIDSMVDCVL